MSEVTNEQLLTELQALRAEMNWLREEWINRYRPNWRNADAYNRMMNQNQWSQSANNHNPPLENA